jgi:hypothetical protein
MRDPGSNPQGGTYVKPGFLLLALSRYNIPFLLPLFPSTHSPSTLSFSSTLSHSLSTLPLSTSPLLTVHQNILYMAHLQSELGTRFSFGFVLALSLSWGKPLRFRALFLALNFALLYLRFFTPPLLDFLRSLIFCAP